MVARVSDGGAADRYEGRPFLRLLELYVLWAVGQLPAENAMTLEQMTPKLQATYGFDAPWPQIIERVMELPADVPQALKEMWERNCRIAADAGTALDPETWARDVVDTNFAGRET